MRLSTRNRVDLPQPDGPIMPVTCRSGSFEVDPLQGPVIAVVEVEVFDGDAGVRWDPDRSLRLGRRGVALLPPFRRNAAPSCSAIKVSSVHARTGAGTVRPRDNQDEHVISRRAGPRQRMPSLVRSERELEDHHRDIGHRLGQIRREYWLLSAVNSSGAVSPLMRAMPSSRPVRMPVRAAG